MEYDAYMLNKLGQKGYDDLMLRAHLHKDRDDKADLIILKALLEWDVLFVASSDISLMAHLGNFLFVLLMKTSGGTGIKDGRNY